MVSGPVLPHHEICLKRLAHIAKAAKPIRAEYNHLFLYLFYILNTTGDDSLYIEVFHKSGLVLSEISPVWPGFVKMFAQSLPRYGGTISTVAVRLNMDLI